MLQALLIVDMQVSLLVEETPNPDEICAAVADLETRARAAGVAVIYITDTRVGPDGALVAALSPQEGDIRVVKSECNAFDGTDLDAELTILAVEHVVICGMQSDACISATLRGAEELGFEITLVADAHTTHAMDGRDFRAVIAQVNETLGALERVRVVNASELSFG
jgi:nicotinamidase-related amidase